jgi:hypothetical protein
MAWALQTDERPNSDENEKQERGWTVFVHPNVKRRPGNLIGETAGDALNNDEQ